MSVLAVDRRSRTREQKITSGRSPFTQLIYLVVNVRMQPHFFFTTLLRLWFELKCYQLPSFK